MDLPELAQEFEQRFATDEACAAYLRRKRWPHGFRCPRCGGGRFWPIRRKALDECAACGHQVSLTAGTIFHGSRKPLRLWFSVVARFLTSKRGCSALEISRVYGLSYETAWTWLHKLRSAMHTVGSEPLRGAVELASTPVDAARLSRRERRLRGRPADLLAGIEDRGRVCGRIRLAAVLSSSVAVAGFVRRYVGPQATIKRSGRAAAPVDETSWSVDDPCQAARLRPRPKSRVVLSLLKRFLLGTYHGSVTRKHIHAYADEFVFRFNRRNSGSRYLLVSRFFERAVERGPTGREIVDRPAGLRVSMNLSEADTPALLLQHAS